MQPRHVELGLLAIPAGDDGLALVVYLEHQLSRLGPTDAEELLEDEGHVGHEVDRVVPDDHHPRPLVLEVLVRDGLLDLDLGRRDDRAHGTNCCERQVAERRTAKRTTFTSLSFPAGSSARTRRTWRRAGRRRRSRAPQAWRRFESIAQRKRRLFAGVPRSVAEKRMVVLVRATFSLYGDCVSIRQRRWAGV